MASTGDFVDAKGTGDGDGEGLVRVNSPCQRDRRADIASLCHPVHKPNPSASNTIAAIPNRFITPHTTADRMALDSR